MDRKQAKKLQRAFNHFADGGELWCVDTLGEWRQQTGITCRILRTENIIKDKHFEARKADALGEEVEVRNVELGNEWKVSLSPSWSMLLTYRPKPKEVYEWQWYYLDKDGSFKLTAFWAEDMCNENIWTKFEPSKRLRK